MTTMILLLAKLLGKLLGYGVLLRFAWGRHPSLTFSCRNSVIVYIAVVFGLWVFKVAGKLITNYLMNFALRHHLKNNRKYLFAER